jgi:hypothetical protein
MVCGMLGSSSFGQFRPDGRVEMDEQTYQERWRERLQKYYEEQTPEEQKRLFDYADDGRHSPAFYYSLSVSKKFDSELGAIVEPGFPPISPIEPHEPPRSYTTRPYKKLGSFIALATWAVDEDLKEIIERLEPGIHEFFPIKIIISADGKLFPKKYYSIRIGKYLDSFVSRGEDGNKVEWSKLCFSKDIFNGCHLWKERKIPALTCFSDELMTQIKDADLLLSKVYKMKEV